MPLVMGYAAVTRNRYRRPFNSMKLHFVAHPSR
jgi:hypothetical protein